MNSEELEQSLRTEFETYLNDIASSMRDSVNEFQKNFEAEFEKHKQQMNDTFRNFSEKLETAPEFDDVFKQSVIEHLRLARDEGAQLAATAFGEAEKLKEQSAVTVSYDLVSNAVKAIKAETSQASILKVLLQHASNFAPRGAFFIVKGEQLAGWKQFGGDGEIDDQGLASVTVPLGSDNLVSRAALTMETTDGAYGLNDADANFADSMNFGKPDRMYAIPLTARGRGVAVLYVDYGSGTSLNIEALETLVSVAGLTVELLAANQTTRGTAMANANAYSPMDDQFNRTNPDLKVEDTFTSTRSEPVSAETDLTTPVSYDPADTGFAFTPAGSRSESVSASGSYEVVEDELETSYAETAYDESEYAGTVSVSEADMANVGPADFSPVSEEPVVQEEYQFEVAAEEESVENESVLEPVPVGVGESAAEGFANGGYEFETGAGYQPGYSESGTTGYTQPESTSVSNESFSPVSPSTDFTPAAETPSAERPRFGRGLDLPIEVSDEERKSHTKARRFARLLVSEIKLYNEQKVSEGRQAGDLFDRLREAIERSREMYDKRVESDVAARFDYFDYELVTDLAEGDINKLGGSYPGPAKGH